MTVLARIRPLGEWATGRSRTFSGRAGIIFAGSVFGQGIAVLTLPVIARMYDVEVLGRAATILAIVSVSALIVCLQYDQAVVVAPRGDLPYLLVLSVGIAAVWTALLGGVILLDHTGFWLGRRHLLASYGINGILAILVFVYSLFTLLVNLGLRCNTLVKVSTARFVYYGGGATIQLIGSILFGARESVFLIAQALAALIAIACLMPYGQIVAWTSRSFGLRDMFAGVHRVARAYDRFPKYQMGDGFVNAVSMYMPIVFLRGVFSDTWAGWYYMGWRLLACPTTLVAQAVGQVFYRDSAERERGGMEQGWLAETVVAALVRSAVPAAIAVAIGIPVVVHVLLGEEWAPVVAIVRVMLVAATVTFCTAPVSMLLCVKGLQANALRYSSVLFAAGLFGLGVGWWFESAIVAVWGYSLLRAIVLLSFLGYILASVKGRVMAIVTRIMPVLMEGTLVLAIVAGLSLTHVLYRPPGIVTVSILLACLSWRDIRRGGWRVA